MTKTLCLCVCLSVLSLSGYGQILDRVLRKAEDKVVEKAGQAMDKATQKKDKSAEPTPAEEKKPAQTSTNQGNTDATPADIKTEPDLAVTPLKAYSKFDFVPGDKVIAYEDFSRVGADEDLPPGWNTNASSEIVTLNNYPGRWMALKGSSLAAFLPEFINTIPENATIEFEMIPTSKSGILYIQIFNEKPNRRQISWSDYRHDGIAIDLYGSWIQMESYIPEQETFQSVSDNSQQDFFEEHVNKAIKVSLWRQKERLRMYFNEKKVMDISRAFHGSNAYNTLQFVKRSENDVYIRNIRVAVGSPDIRAKLAAGKFTTNGILFNVNEATLKPESYGTLKQIADALKADPAMKLKITGHTDSDGDATKNLSLSKRRAEAVRQALSNEFGLDAARFETDGKGATQPVAPNTTAEGKANNRRVEFVKL